MGYEIQIGETDEVDAIYERGAATGARVVGRTENGMLVYLDMADLPFALADLEQTNLGTYDAAHRNVRVYAITAAQREAVLAALAAKVAASEPVSRDPRTAVALGTR